MQGECDIWRSRACGYKKKGRPHEPKVSRKKSEDYRADLFTKFLEPDRHHKLIKLLPLSVPGTRREVANSVALGGGVLAVSSQGYNKQPDRSG